MKDDAQPKAVILFSGGLDSTVALAQAKKEGRVCYPLFVDYGQLNLRQEQRAVYTVAHWLDVPLATVRLRDIMRVRETQSCYMPGRNAVLFALAASLAEQNGATEIWAGIAQTSVAPITRLGNGKWRLGKVTTFADCSDAFVSTMQTALRCSSPALRKLHLIAPLMYCTKVMILQKALQLDVPLVATRSCLLGNDLPCGECDACRSRRMAEYQLLKRGSDKEGELGIIEEAGAQPAEKGD